MPKGDFLGLGINAYSRASPRRNSHSVGYRWRLRACIFIFWHTQTTLVQMVLISAGRGLQFSEFIVQSVVLSPFTLGDTPFRLVGPAGSHERGEGCCKASASLLPQTPCIHQQRVEIMWIKVLIKLGSGFLPEIKINFFTVPRAQSVFSVGHLASPNDQKLSEIK